jgi:hypothetical protein
MSGQQLKGVGGNLFIVPPQKELLGLSGSQSGGRTCLVYRTSPWGPEKFGETHVEAGRESPEADHGSDKFGTTTEQVLWGVFGIWSELSGSWPCAGQVWWRDLTSPVPVCGSW